MTPMKYHFNCAWICAVLPHCRAGEAVRQGTVVINAKQSESQISEGNKLHSWTIFVFPLRFEYSLTSVTKYKFNSLVWVKPRKSKCPCETCQPISRINPDLCQGVPLEQRVSSPQTAPAWVISTSLRVFLEGRRCAGEEKLFARETGRGAGPGIAPCPPAASPLAAEWHCVHSRWFQQALWSPSKRSSTSVTTYGFFPFALAAWGRKHSHWMQDVAMLCPELKHGSFIRTDCQRNIIFALSFFLTRANGAVFPVNFQLGY